MDVLAYNSGFDFVDIIKEFDYDYVKFAGCTSNGTYVLGVDNDDELLYISVPVDEYDGKVRRIAPLGLKQGVILARRINYSGNSTTQSGKSISYKRVLADCNIFNQFLDDEVKIEGNQINMEGFFHKSNFTGFDNGLTIKDSSIEVVHMFGDSRGLTDVTFKNCELSSLVGLTQNSDVECVTFENCSLVVTDNSHLNSWGQKLEAGCLDEIFGRKTTTVNLTGCDDSLIEELIKLNSRVQQFFRELEINILD